MNFDWEWWILVVIDEFMMFKLINNWWWIDEMIDENDDCKLINDVHA